MLSDLLWRLLQMIQVCVGTEPLQQPVALCAITQGRSPPGTGQPQWESSCQILEGGRGFSPVNQDFTLPRFWASVSSSALVDPAPCLLGQSVCTPQAQRRLVISEYTELGATWARSTSCLNCHFDTFTCREQRSYCRLEGVRTALEHTSYETWPSRSCVSRGGHGQRVFLSRK